MSAHTATQIPVQLSPDDHMKPRPMPEPRVLYRSVSLPELVDIWRKGVITGGGNLFNFMDQRPYVFFADEIDERLIRQGEYVDRQAHYALREHRINGEIERKLDRTEQIADVILAEMGHHGIAYDLDLTDNFRLGIEHRCFRNAAFRSPKAVRLKFAALFRILRRLQRELIAAYGEYDRQHQLRWAEIEQHLARLPYSSAIIVTHPIGGGLLYSTEFGASGLGDREYGFRPGQVTIEDIAEVILIKARREVDRCFPRNLGRRLADLEDCGLDQLLSIHSCVE